MQGVVSGVHKTGYNVIVKNKTYFCITNNSYSSPDKPAVGDKVILQKVEDQHLILEHLPRKTIIGRYDHERNKFQTFAVNVNVVFVVTSANKEFSPNRIQRFLNLVKDQPIRKVIVITKKDLTDNMNDYIDQLSEIEDIEVTTINSTCPDDVFGLLNFVKRGQTMLLMGSSGVGKSTITNTLTGLSIKTQPVMSDKHGNRGKHTTSSRNMYPLPDNKKIIDSPGIKIISTEDCPPTMRR